MEQYRSAQRRRVWGLEQYRSAQRRRVWGLEQHRSAQLRRVAQGSTERRHEVVKNTRSPKTTTTGMTTTYNHQHPETDACKSTRPKTCRNTTFTRLNSARPSTTSHNIMGPHSRSPYPAHVTVYPYNEYISGTNPVVRHVISLTGTLKRMRANQRVPKHSATQPLHGSTPRARAPNLVIA